MIQMQGYGQSYALAIEPYGCSYICRSGLFVLQRSLQEIRSAPHKAIGQIRSLQYGRAAKHGMGFYHRLGLTYGIDIKGPLGIGLTLLGHSLRGIQDTAHRH